MLREFDGRRSAPRAALVTALMCMPLLGAAASALRAQDLAQEGSVATRPPEAVLRDRGDGKAAAVMAQARSLKLDVPLPPYPPPIFGLEERERKAFPEAPGTALLARTLSGERSPETSAPAPRREGELTDAGADAPRNALTSEPEASIAAQPQSSGPAPLAVRAVASPDISPSATADVMGAAFAKAAVGALFPRLAKGEREAITAYYQKRDFAPLWHADGAPTKAALALLDRLAHASEEGLDPDDYAAAATPAASKDAGDLAEAEWRISAAVISYARDARGARVVPTHLSGLITPKLSLPDAQTVLDALSRASDASAALEAFNPRADGYLGLRLALAHLRAEMHAPSSTNGDGVANAQLASVAQETLKERRGSAVDQAATRAVSALSPKRIEADIVANMERWRWLPPELGDRYILVNVPEFTLRYITHGVVTHKARVIVGKPSSPTPLFSGDMKFLVVNPSWYVPPSILKKEFLPKLAEDPLYAERQGYEVIQHGDRISIRQPPGERNALGRIKFMFPNDHAVYLHDTPTRNLFAKADRAFSHGCVRVEQPFKLAEYVLNDEAAWPQKRIEKMVGGAERTINLAQQLPVHLAYFTLLADDEGRLERFGDLYGLDPRLEAMLMPRK
jgi:murein L,D-transpeptidase YcbB/YkuD